MFAASIRDTELVKALLRRHADPCHADSRGLTAVVVARVYGNAPVVDLLGKATLACDDSGGASE